MMWSSGVTFERESLYEEVWSTPLTQLGKKYGMSDNGMRRVCKAMNIPLPRRGHWARIAAGQKVERRHLPTAAERESFHSFRHGSGSFPDEASADRDWLRERIEAERSPESRIQVPLEPQEWHRAIEPLRQSLDKFQEKERIAQSKREDSQRQRALLKLRTGQHSPNLDSFQWWGIPDDGSALINRYEPNVLQVSHATFHRALAIANALAFAAQARRCSVNLNTQRSRLEIGLEDGSLSIRIDELQESRRPTDRLSIVAYRPSGSKLEFIDDTVPVQGRLNELFVRLYRAAISARSATREARAREIKWEMERKQAEERRREEEIRKEQAAREALRRKELMSEVTHWQQAQQIRAYVAQVGGNSEWHVWALGIADEIDPLPSRRASLFWR
jgi:hypothetical protein